MMKYNLLLLVLCLFCASDMQIAGANELPDVLTGMHNGRPAIFIDGTPQALPGYCPYYTRQFFERYVDRLYEDKLDMLFIAIGSMYEGRFWKGDENYGKMIDGSQSGVLSLDEQAESHLKNNPDAWIIIRLRHKPPDSWCENNPSEFFIDEEGNVHDTPSLASDRFWEDASSYCRELVAYCESRPWAKRVIGYMNIHLAEGVHFPVAEGFLYDHNPAMTLKLRNYLHRKYGTVEKLREAYGDESLTFDAIGVPRDKLRGSVPEVMDLLYWQDRSDNVALRDYLELMKELWHQRFTQICAGMTAGAGRNVLMMHDVFKQPMAGWNHNGFFAIGQWRTASWSPAYPELMAGSGSMGVTALFDNTPGFDALVTPHDYQMRGLGGVYEPEGMADSSVLRGKYFLSEMDTRYCLSCREDGSQRLGGAHSPKDWAAITWRNVATGLTRGFHSYWHHSWTVNDDWWFDDEVHEIITRQADVIRESLNWKHEDVPGIAMIIDDTSVLETNGTGNYLNEAVMWEYKLGLARCGVPFRTYMFEDLALEQFPKHCVYYFPNLFRIDSERMALLKEKVFRDGNIVVWGPGTGISDGSVIGIESAIELTGFSFRVMPANAQRRIQISNFDHPLTAGLDEALFIGGTLPYGPVLIPTDGLELGRLWTKGGLNEVGMAFREYGKGAAGNGKNGHGPGDYASLFMTAVQLPADLWRNIARYGGAHVYSEGGEILLADRNIVAMHSLKSGRKTIMLPEKRPVRDLVTGKRISRGTKTITFNMDAPATAVFLLEDENE